MNLSGFYTVVITLFILMAVGYFAYRLHIVDDTAANRLSKLIICIGQPCMIINAFVKYQYTKSDFINGFTVVGLGIFASCADGCYRPCGLQNFSLPQY